MREIHIVYLDPPQPCGIQDRATGQVCAQAARIGAIEGDDGVEGGYLRVLPVCDACASARVDNPALCVDEHELVLVTHSVALPEVPQPGVLREAAQLLDEQATRMRGDARILRERADELAALN
jgi:hypothetical protein